MAEVRLEAIDLAKVISTHTHPDAIAPTVAHIRLKICAERNTYQATSKIFALQMAELLCAAEATVAKFRYLTAV